MRGLTWGLVAWVALVSPVPPALSENAAQPQAKGPETQDSTDWPVVISKLQQEVYQRPGYAQARQQLATAHNNYGVSLGHQGQWDLAVRELQEAMRLDGSNEPFRKNLANLYVNQASQEYEHHQANEALELLEKAVALNPDVVQAYILQGKIQYEQQKLKEAKAAWQRAVKLDPTQTELARRLAQVTQELPVESKFARLSQAFFDVRYEEGLDRPAGYDIQDDLLEARRLVGSDFAYWPKHKIVVLIYSAESFRALRQETPEWVAGQFDGKIRVPLPNTRLDQATVKQILFHEYTHAVIQDLTNGKCPTWFNEGLAEYEGAKDQPRSLRKLTKASSEGRLVPWDQLSVQFSTSLPVDEVKLGYEQSHSIVLFLVERYGFWRIRRLLKAVGDGRPWEVVFAEELHTKLSRLEAGWREWLSGFLKAATSQ